MAAQGPMIAPRRSVWHGARLDRNIGREPFSRRTWLAAHHANGEAQGPLVGFVACVTLDLEGDTRVG